MKLTQYRSVAGDRDCLHHLQGSVHLGFPHAPISAPMQPLLREQFNILWQASGWADGSPSFS